MFKTYITNVITNVITKIFQKKVSNPIGRWRIEQCNIKMNHKVDLSNEDHCGPCGQYALSKIEMNKKTQCKDKKTKNIIIEKNNF
jgi:hypothetical protein